MSIHDFSTVDGSNGSEFEPAVQPVVKDLLIEHEAEDSLLTGTIRDVATINPDDRYDNFEIGTGKIINASDQLIKSVANSDTYQNVIAIAVEMPSGDVFIDLFTYESANDTDYPSVESLAMAVGVDVSSVHHLVGESVDIVQSDGRWTICEHREMPPIEPTVTARDFLTPFLITFLLVPLSLAVGWQLGFPLFILFAASVAVCVILYLGLLYLVLAAKRDHPRPGILGRIYAPDYTSDEGVVHEDEGIVNVQNGEFQRIITLVDESEYDSPRAVLHNLGVVVKIPPVGDKTIPIKAPTIGWRGTLIKNVVYTLSNSVENLDRARGKLLPLVQTDNRIEIDRDRLSVEHHSRRRTLLEETADAYVAWVNGVFNTPSRSDTYS